MGEAALRSPRLPAPSRRHRRVPLPGRRLLLLEMNTRLQWSTASPRCDRPRPRQEQLRVAAGAKLSFTQSRSSAAATPSSAASTPRTRQRVPALPRPDTKFNRPDGFGVRTDAGYDAGLEVSQYYDNLTAKLVTWGPDGGRPPADAPGAGRVRDRGVRTTIPAQVALLANRPSSRPALHQVAGGGGRPRAADGGRGAAAARRRRPPPTARPSRSSPYGPRGGGRAPLSGQGVAARVRANSRPAAGAAAGRSAGRAGRSRSAASGGGGAAQRRGRLPDAGPIVKALVSVGDAVEVGQGVVVLEAMKMENHIVAERRHRVGGAVSARRHGGDGRRPGRID